MAQQTEIERKFTLQPGQQVPQFDCAQFGQTETFTMRAVYYDTPAYDLTKSGAATLRRREGGADQGWHLKLRRSADERLEVHAPLQAELVPSELRAEVADLVGQAPLVPVAVLTTHRAETELLSPTGDVLGQLCRDEVTAEVGSSTEQWLELEVETVAGDLAWLDRVTAELAAAGIHPAESASKLGRALSGVVAQPPFPATAGSVLVAYLAVQVGVLQSRADDVVADAPDAVHKSRVATRRLRSALRTFRKLVEPQQELRAELKWHAEQLGAPRDAEVLLERLLAVLDRLPPEQANGPVRQRLTESLHATHAEAHADLVHSMAKPRYTALHLALQQLVVDPPLTDLAAADPAAVLPRLAHRAAHRVAAAAAEAATDPEDLASWHEVRKLAKAARYSHEALADHFGAPAIETAAKWEAVTESLGEVQDTQVGRERIREVAHDAARAGEPTEPYDHLTEIELADGVIALAAGRQALSEALAASFEPGGADTQ